MDLSARTSRPGYNWLQPIFSRAVAQLTCSRVALTGDKFLPTKSLVPAISTSLEKAHGYQRAQALERHLVQRRAGRLNSSHQNRVLLLPANSVAGPLLWASTG